MSSSTIDSRIVRLEMLQRFQHPGRVGYTAENPTLHRYHFESRLMIADIRRPGAIFQNQTFITSVVRFPHRRMHTYIGGNAS